MEERLSTRPTPQNLKISLFCPYAIENANGGVQEHTKRLGQFLEEAGHQVVIVAPRYQDIEKGASNIIYIGTAEPVVHRQTTALIAKRPVWPQTVKDLFRIPPDICSFQEPEVSAPSMEALWFSPATNIVTFHATQEDSFRYRLYGFIASRLYARKVDGCIAVSETNRNFIQKYFPKDYRIIPNGVDTSRFNPDITPIPEYLDDKLTILFVGRLEGRKGLTYLLKAFALLKSLRTNVKLVIVGSGPEAGNLNLQVADQNIPDVHFVGKVPAEDLPHYYALADIFCSPATHDESFGIVNLEAMATAIPVIAGDNPGYRELITHCENGFLVTPQNTQEFANYLKMLLQFPNVRREMGKINRQKALLYDWNKIGQQILDYYLEILKRKRLID